MTEEQRKRYQLQIYIVKTIGYAIGLMRGHQIPEADEIEANFDYIIEEFSKERQSDPGFIYEDTKIKPHDVIVINKDY